MDTNENLEAVASAKAPVSPAEASSDTAKAAAEVVSERAEVKKNKERDAATAAAIAAQQAITGTHQEHVQEALELLYKHFPQAFIKEGDCKPLKVGILEDLKPKIGEIEGLSVSKVRAAVRFYTSRLRYFYAMREGAMRIDLEGNEIEPVSAEHAEYARTRFTEINAKRRPAKPKRNAKGKGPRRNAGQGQGQGGQGGQGARAGGFNRRRPNGQGSQNGRPQGQGQRRFEPAKVSDLKVGRHVSVKFEQSFARATIVEEPQGDKVKIAAQNGMTSVMPINCIFISTGPRGDGQKRPFNRGRNNQRRGPNAHGPKAQAEGHAPAGSSAPKGNGSN